MKKGKIILFVFAIIWACGVLSNCANEELNEVEIPTEFETVMSVEDIGALVKESYDEALEELEELESNIAEVVYNPSEKTWTTNDEPKVEEVTEAPAKKSTSQSAVNTDASTKEISSNDKTSNMSTKAGNDTSSDSASNKSNTKSDASVSSSSSSKTTNTNSNTSVSSSGSSNNTSSNGSSSSSSSSSSTTTTSNNAPNTHGKKVYRTPTGKKYHYDPNCGGKNSYETTSYSDLDPCKKCVY